MKNIFGLILLFAVAFFASCDPKQKADNTGENAVEQPAKDYKYCNEKYGFCINVDTDSLTVKENNEEGRIYTGSNGLAELLVHTGNRDGSIKGGIDQLKDAYEKDIIESGKRIVTGKTYDMDRYTVMGYENKTAFYQKTIIKKGKIATVYLEYDDSVKDTYYPLIATVIKSFE